MKGKSDNFLTLLAIAALITALAAIPLFWDGICIVDGSNKESTGVCTRQWMQSIGTLIIPLATIYLAQKLSLHQISLDEIGLRFEQQKLLFHEIQSINKEFDGTTQDIDRALVFVLDRNNELGARHWRFIEINTKIDAIISTLDFGLANYASDNLERKRKELRDAFSRIRANSDECISRIKREQDNFDDIVATSVTIIKTVRDIYDCYINLLNEEMKANRNAMKMLFRQ